MEPLTTIQLGSCKWLGVLALVVTIAAQTLHMANEARLDPCGFASREFARRGRRLQSRTR
jgi:hypothetical protein